jgi:hypothetical protein
VGVGVWRLTVHCCDSHLHCAGQGGSRVGFLTQLGSSHTHTLMPQSSHPQHSRHTPRCPSVVLWMLCSGVEACVRTDRFGEAARTGKQPANLAVEGAEESLSILPDYTLTVRPPPKRC